MDKIIFSAFYLSKFEVHSCTDGLTSLTVGGPSFSPCGRHFAGDLARGPPSAAPLPPSLNPSASVRGRSTFCAGARIGAAQLPSCSLASSVGFASLPLIFHSRPRRDSKGTGRLLPLQQPVSLCSCGHLPAPPLPPPIGLPSGWLRPEKVKRTSPEDWHGKPWSCSSSV